ncbi:MAG: histidine kinase N-terminal domain-containing protein [Phascolarctobacterium sp.]|nr:histidine kinase N-terminal domain-containing protein [Phascolarctobacterium sp.]
MLSTLTAEQKNKLQTLLSGLELAADIAHARVTIYLSDNDKRFLQVLKQVRPLTQRCKAQPDLTGRKVRVVEEPLVQRTLQQNIPLRGMRELELGVFNSFFVYPLSDVRGKCYGALSFDTVDPDEVIIRETVELLWNLPKPVEQEGNYKRLSAADGLLVVNKDKVIIAANNEAKHLFQVMGVRDLLGKRTNHLEINWPIVGMVIDAGVAESKEFTSHGSLLAVRVLPVVPKANGGSAIVILQDITELRKKEEALEALNAELADLKESLETRKLLDKAKGILMAAHGMTEQEAYRKLQQFSMAKRISLKELAEKIIASSKSL